jgi:hypothetical protein
MQYMLLIYGDEAAWEQASSDEKSAEYARHRAFGDWVRELGGEVVSAAPLEPTNTATSIRGDQIMDGPFVDTKESLDGFYIIEATDLDHALAIARNCPVHTGGIEVRPLVDMVAG